MEEKNNPTKFEQMIASLSENDVAVFDHIGNVPQEAKIFHQNDSRIAVLCTHGKATCQIDDKVVEIRPNNLFLSNLKDIEHVMTSIDFTCCGFLMSSNFLKSILMLENSVWDVKFVLDENPVIPLNEQEADNFIHDQQILSYKLSLPHTPHYKEAINLLLQSIVYEFFDCIKPKLQLTNYTYSSSKSIFKRFMSLAAESTPLHRNLQYYADKLCITPKYLSAICKQHTGKPASDIINDLAINQIKRLLRSEDKSVKEIASQSGFDNLSFFGKYVKRSLGVSPREYRLKQTE